MASVTFLLMALVAGVCLVPVWLLRQRAHQDRAQDDFVGSQHTRPEVVRNASIAYALRLTAFVPLFAAGANGDFWPAIVGCTAFGLGVWLVYRLRGPLVAFVDRALSSDRSVTVHEFIAQQHGNDARVRLLAASLTVIALVGLLAGEVLALTILVEPLLPQSAVVVYAFVFGTLLLTFVYATLAGDSGVMQAAQLQLGLLYLGLFGSTAVLLYLHVSAVTPMPPHGTLAVVFVAAFSATLLYYRRSKYVDTERIRQLASDGDNSPESPAARILSRFGKILNTCVSICVGVVVIVAVMEFFAAGLPTLVANSAAALQSRTSVPGLGLVALCLLALVHPLVDVTNWQRLAALRQGMHGNRIKPDEQRVLLRGAFRMYAAEACLVWLFMCMLGAIATIAIETPGAPNALQLFVARLDAADDTATAIIVPLFVIFIFAAALSTMSALLSACLCTLRYDIMPALRRDASSARDAATEAGWRGRTLVPGAGLCVVAGVLVCAIEGTARAGFSTSAFLALLLALCCVQLSFAPLVLGPVVGHAKGLGNVGPEWALQVMTVGAVGGVVAVTIYAATAVEAWLWAAVPLCLGSGFVLFAIGCAARRRSS